MIYKITKDAEGVLQRVPLNATESIWKVYSSKEQAEADLDNLDDGMIIATLEPDPGTRGLDTDNVPVLFRDGALETTDAPFPEESKKKKVGLIATRTDAHASEWSIEWGEAGGSGSGTTKVFATKEALEDALAITDMNDENYIPNNALVIIEEDGDEAFVEVLPQGE